MLLLHHSSSPCCPQRIKKMGNDAQLVKMQSQVFAPVNIVYSKKPFYEKFCPLGGHYCTRKSSYYWSRQYQCGRHLADIQQEDEPSAFERINSASCYRVCQLFAQRFASLPLVMPYYRALERRCRTRGNRKETRARRKLPRPNRTLSRALL